MADDVLRVLKEFPATNSQQLNKKDLATAVNSLQRDSVRFEPASQLEGSGA